MDFTKFRDYLDGVVKDGRAPGVDCIVTKEYDVVFRYFSGMSDIANKKAMQGDEQYLIFSMTKMLTCTCALQLLEQGKYLLNDPVSMYLPEFEKMKISNNEIDADSMSKIATGQSMGASTQISESGYAKNPILIKHLFSMTAGLDYDLQSESIRKALAEGRTSTRELVRAISETVLGFEPGTHFRYSLCHDVLGALVEVWSGKKLSDYMKENIFNKLGMKRTFFGVPKDRESFGKMAILYNRTSDGKFEEKPIEIVYNLSEEYESGGAGLSSCTEDYSLFLEAMANGGVGRYGNRILSKASIDLMRTNQLCTDAYKDFGGVHNGYGYGLGVRIHVDKSASGSLSSVGEFGWDGAAGAFSMVDPENRISVTYFQHMHGWDVRLQRELRNVLYSCIER